MRKCSTAILCIARNETPYVSEWIEHHLSLGIDQIYFISTDEIYGETVSYFEQNKLPSKVRLFHFDDFAHGWQMRCYNQFLPQIKEDWFFVLDLDEFIYLNKYANIGEFLDILDNEVGQVQFPWLNTFSYRYQCESVLGKLEESPKYASDHVKSMVRRSHCVDLGVHSHHVGKLATVLSSGDIANTRNSNSIFIQDTAFYNTNPFIFHFCSRGHLDMINRIVDHQFFNDKNGNRERNRLIRFLNNEFEFKNIPNRYLLLKFLETLPEVKLQRSYPKYSAITDNKKLQEIFFRTMCTIENLDGINLSIPGEYLEKRFSLQSKVDLINLTGKIDLDEYLSCGSQLEYIGKLRKKLKS